MAHFCDDIPHPFGEETEAKLTAAIARARQALEKGEGIEVNTRVRLGVMLQAVFNKCQEYRECVERLRRELATLQAASL